VTSQFESVGNRWKPLVQNFRFAYWSMRHNPGQAAMMVAFEKAERALYDELRSTSSFAMPLRDINWCEIKWNGNESVLPDSAVMSVAAPSDGRFSNLFSFGDLPERDLRAFASENDAGERHDQFNEKFARLKGQSRVRLRDWPDDLLTELLWELAHHSEERVGEVELEFDDASVCRFPVGGRRVRQAEGARGDLYLAMISNRHPEMDAMTHGSLFLNRETQLDGALSVLASATRERSKEFFTLAKSDLCIHVFQTGLAAVVVGLWLGIFDTPQPPLIVPRFFRRSSGDSYRASSYAIGRVW